MRTCFTQVAIRQAAKSSGGCKQANCPAGENLHEIWHRRLMYDSDLMNCDTNCLLGGLSSATFHGRNHLKRQKSGGAQPKWNCLYAGYMHSSDIFEIEIHQCEGVGRVDL